MLHRSNMRLRHKHEMPPGDRQEAVLATGACSPSFSMSVIEKCSGDEHGRHMPTMASHSPSHPQPLSQLKSLGISTPEKLGWRRENDRHGTSCGFGESRSAEPRVNFIPRRPFAGGLPADGFTLIELLITVTILAILAAIAYPSYRTQVENTRRADMQSELMSRTEYLERKHAELGCYNFAHDANTKSCDTPGTPLAVPFEATNGYYDVTFVDGTLTASTYVLRATPKGSQSDNGALFIDQAQRRHWDENNDGDTDDPGENNWKRG